LNGFVIWLHKKPNWKTSKGTRRRRIFLLELAKALVLPNIEDRASDVNGLSIAVQRAIQAMLNRPVQSLPQSTAATDNKARKYAMCIQAWYGKGYKLSKKNANKVKQCCEQCKKPVYMKHPHKASGITCNNCTDH